MNTAKNDITGDLIKSKTNNTAYADGYDRIFGNKKNNKTVYMIDPPSGWKYGFPKEYDESIHKSIENLLLESGYPEKDIDFALENCRMWSKTR